MLGLVVAAGMAGLRFTSLPQLLADLRHKGPQRVRGVEAFPQGLQGRAVELRQWAETRAGRAFQPATARRGWFPSRLAWPLRMLRCRLIPRNRLGIYLTPRPELPHKSWLPIGTDSRRADLREVRRSSAI